MWLVFNLALLWIAIGLTLIIKMSCGDYEYDQDRVCFEGKDSSRFKGRLGECFRKDPMDGFKLIGISIAFWPLIIYFIIIEEI